LVRNSSRVTQSGPGPQKDLDGIRRKYLGQLADLTGRNVVAFLFRLAAKIGNQISPFLYFRCGDAGLYDGR
jgi:hypothetical protein